MRVRNFRSIGSTPLDIKLGRKVTIFIGPNNSGKSNLLRALRLILAKPDKPLALGEVKAHPYDIHAGINPNPVKESKNPDQMIGNCEVTYSFTPNDYDRIVDDVFDSVYPFLKYNVDKERLVRGILKEIVSAYLKTPFQAIGILEKRGDEEVVLKRAFTGPPWILSDKGKQTRIDQHMKRISELLGHQDEHKRIFQAIIESTCPIHGVVPRGSIPLRPQAPIAFNDLRSSSPTPDTLRGFMVMMQNDELKKLIYDMHFSRIVKVIRRGFPATGSIDASLDPETHLARILFGGFEIGCQGDGLKQLLMFLVYLSHFKGDVVIVDEPERYMHPEIEASLVDYFLDFGTGQFVIATHSESIVNSIPSESIESEDVIVYGVLQDRRGHTKIERGTDSTIVAILEKLGVPTTRYVKHMAALARTLIFVEGPTDRTAIRRILEHHGRLQDLERYHPYFVSMGGVRNFSKISSDVIDSIAKGDNEIESPTVPYLIVKDSDEGTEKGGPNEVVLSCREIENLVVSRDSIWRIAQEYLAKLGLISVNPELSTFEGMLSISIKRYIHKWALLKMRNLVDKKVRYALRWESTPDDRHRSKDTIAQLLERDRERISSISEKIDIDLSEERHTAVRNELLSKCFFDDDSPNYGYISDRIPGKDFIRYVMRDALIETARMLMEKLAKDQPISESRIAGLAGAMCNLEAFLKHSTVLPVDLETLLQELETVQV